MPSSGLYRYSHTHMHVHAHNAHTNINKKNKYFKFSWIDVYPQMCTI